MLGNIFNIYNIILLWKKNTLFNNIICSILIRFHYLMKTYLNASKKIPTILFITIQFQRYKNKLN